MKKCNVIRTFFRSLFLQAVWNFERMQNVGFLYSVMPCLKEIYAGDDKRLKEAAMRNFDFFNTHPYIANTIIALTLILETEPSPAEDVKAQQIKALKLHLGGPLAAIGDTFFWSRLRPLCGLLAAGCLFTGGICRWGYFLVPFIFIFLYNIPHVFFRFFGFWMGLHYKTDVVRIISNFKFQKISRIIQVIGIFTCIFVFFVYVRSSVKYGLLGFVMFVVSFGLIRKNVSVTSVFWGLAAVCVGIGFLRVYG